MAASGWGAVLACSGTDVENSSEQEAGFGVSGSVADVSRTWGNALAAPLRR